MMITSLLDELFSWAWCLQKTHQSNMYYFIIYVVYKKFSFFCDAEAQNHVYVCLIMCVCEI